MKRRDFTRKAPFMSVVKKMVEDHGGSLYQKVPGLVPVRQLVADRIRFLDDWLKLPSALRQILKL